MTSLLDTALAYHQAGLVVLPNDPTLKYPSGLRGWQSVSPSEADVRRWFGNGKQHAIGVRDVEGLDFDNKGAPDANTLLREWTDLCEQLAPGLPKRLLLERTPSGGYHLVWRCETIQGNQKLATRPPTPAELAASPKLTSVALIETRGKGGQFQVAPSPGYTLMRGDWSALPTIATAERQIVLDCARALTRTDRRTLDLVQRSTGDRPGDLYNRDHADSALKLLEQAGWAVVRERDNALYLCRPGKDQGISATFGYVAPGVLYVFSSNASPFEPNHAYSPFAIFTEILHNGDYKAAAAALRGEKVEPRSRVNLTTGEILEERTYTTIPTMPMDVNDLLAMERKAVIWYAPGFLREGLGVLIGQPNVGKTPLLIQLAIALATGGKWMNAVQCKSCRVLFLGVEYTRQEIIPLTDISRCGVTIPRGQLLVKTMEDDFPTTPEDALAELEWYIRVLGVDVIIIDVMTAFLPPEKFKQNVYRGDYTELKPYHRLASMHNAAILGSWHASKRESDPKLMYNGSTGMWAVPASRITLYQDQEQRVRIASYPRMSDKTEWALTQDHTQTGRRWIAADVAPEPAMSQTELTIYRFLKQHATKATPLGPGTIAEMTSLPVNTIKVTIRRMFEKNLVQQAGSMGGYFVTVVTDVTPVTPVTDVTVQSYTVTNVTENGVLGYIDPKHQEASNDVGLQGLHDSSVTPIDAMPGDLHMTMRMMLMSDAKRNIEMAQARCVEYGIDYDEARRWAIQWAKEH
jgi:AAA domain-containing protein/bifunctional DNA primase/polymerase-like protein